MVVGVTIPGIGEGLQILSDFRELLWSLWTLFIFGLININFNVGLSRKFPPRQPWTKRRGKFACVVVHSSYREEVGVLLHKRSSIHSNHSENSSSALYKNSL